MNAAHIVGRKRNRLKRCRKKLASGELTGGQRLALENRASELEKEVGCK